jgi:predicted RNA-binding Zn-ribbon protein involved in translation (DUF1610 family)
LRQLPKNVRIQNNKTEIPREVNEMDNLKCPQCGKAMEDGVAVCGSCGREVKEDEIALPYQNPEKRPGSKKLYAILAVLLVLLGGAALLIFTGLLPNPLPGRATIAIVNGEKISEAEVNQRLDTYKETYGRAVKMDFSSPEGKKTLENVRKEIVKILIYERVLATEAAKENITVSPQEVADRIAAIKKGLNLSDQGYEKFVRDNGTSLADFTKQIEREILFKKLIEYGTQRGLKKDAWISALRERAKVEVLR